MKTVKPNDYAMSLAKRVLRGRLAIESLNPNQFSLSANQICHLMTQAEVTINDLVEDGYARRTVNSWRLIGRAGEEAIEVMEAIVWSKQSVRCAA